MTDAPETPFPLPELMRGLRAFGSSRALPGADHDRYFAPLVESVRALRSAHERALASGTEPWRAADAVDATRAGTRLRATLAAIAAERFPDSAPDRRALEAELADEADPLFDALDALDAEARRLREAADDERAAAWRRWTAALVATLAAADGSWARAVPVLRETPAPPRAARRRGA